METPTTPTSNSGGNNNEYIDIDNYLSQCETALTNALLDEIAPKLAARGYDATEIADKLAEVAVIRDLNENQKKEYGEQYQATADYTNAENTLHSNYIDHLDIARIVFKKDFAAQAALGLNSKRKITQSGYQAQALLFYNNALKNADYKAALAKRGITEAELTTHQTNFKALSDLQANQRKETGEAQAATKLRDAALHEFEEWMSDFKEIAIIALKDSPQLREQLGWKE
jgi:hypothetical protein